MIELVAFIAGIAMLLFVGYTVFDISNVTRGRSPFDK